MHFKLEKFLYVKNIFWDYFLSNDKIAHRSLSHFFRKYKVKRLQIMVDLKVTLTFFVKSKFLLASFEVTDYFRVFRTTGLLGQKLGFEGNTLVIQHQFSLFSIFTIKTKIGFYQRWYQYNTYVSIQESCFCFEIFNCIA